MTDERMRCVTEFDVEIDAKAPREEIGNVILDTAQALCIRHGLKPTDNIVLATEHQDSCPDHGKAGPPNFEHCECFLIRVHILVATDALIRQGQDMKVLHPAAIDPEKAN